MRTLLILAVLLAVSVCCGGPTNYVGLWACATSAVIRVPTIPYSTRTEITTNVYRTKQWKVINNFYPAPPERWSDEPQAFYFRLGDQSETRLHPNKEIREIWKRVFLLVDYENATYTNLHSEELLEKKSRTTTEKTVRETGEWR